jgi:predicted transcriptional regulator
METDATPTTETGAEETGETKAEETRVWMVERTFSADSPHILVVVYATPDGTRYLRKEWAFNRHGSSPGPTVTAARDVEAERLAAVDEAETRERYRKEAERMRERHDPDDAV